MHSTINLLHSFNRYFILIAIFFVLYRSLNGWLRRTPFTKMDDTASLVLLILADVQLILGGIQYWFTSGYTTAAFANMKAAMKDSTLRYFAIEHISMMLIAIVLIHVGRSASKKALEDTSKHKKLAIFTGLALLMIVIALAPKGLLMGSVADWGN